MKSYESETIEDQSDATPRRPLRRDRFRKLRESRQARTLRVEEIAGLGAAALLLIASVFFYFYSLTPARERLLSLELEHNRMQTRLQREASHGSEENTQASVEEINASLRDFELNYLPTPREGRTSVIEELNELIRRNHLRITAALTFTQLEAAVSQNASAQTSKEANQQNWFPGIQVNLTVEGAYPNVRRLVRDVEASRRFMIIHGVELEGVTDKSAPSIAVAGSDGAPVMTNQARDQSLVSLRLSLAAYFQRA